MVRKGRLGIGAWSFMDCLVLGAWFASIAAEWRDAFRIISECKRHALSGSGVHDGHCHWQNCVCLVPCAIFRRKCWGLLSNVLETGAR
eukprot:1217847-Lingulodinium_polyedra.AAC.1